MNYYEILDPYYALVKAKSKEGAVKKYIETVAGDESDFENLMEECKVVPEYYAAARFSRATDEEDYLMELEEIVETLQSNKTEILVVDGSLI